MLSEKIVINARAGIHDFVNVGDNGNHTTLPGRGHA